MHYSHSFIMLQLVFLQLRDSAYLIEGEYYYESRKNLLKDFLREQKWTKKQIKEALKIWLANNFLILKNERLYFIFTEPRKYNQIIRITGIE